MITRLTGKKLMLQHIDITHLLKRNTLGQIGDMFELSTSMVQAEASRQIRKESNKYKNYDELGDPMLGISGSWMKSEERRVGKILKATISNEKQD